MLHVMLPPNLLELRRIIMRDHQDILEVLTPDANIDVTLAEIATELGIAVDGVYEVNDLCEMLLWELDNRTRRQKGLPTRGHYRGLKMIQTEIELEVKPKKEEPELDSSLPLIGVDKPPTIQ